ncbi:MAG: rhomboid family intramembrane serine protease [Sphaerochaetaceae bacterium]|nr:rhomboid family intramembrane serine protease [Sphaerochaetaceae bacterium]
MDNGLLNRKFKYTFSNATYVILGLNLMVFFMVYLLNIRIGGTPLGYWLSLIPSFVDRGYVWQFLTYMFMHGSWSHLFFNMFGLVMFGLILERELGTKEFLCYYFVCGILSGIFSYIVYKLTGVNPILMGASGALYALLLLFAVLFPTAQVRLFFFIPMKAPVAVLVFFAIELISEFTGLNVNLAHMTHLAGLLFGYLYCLIRLKINPFSVWRKML